MDLYNSDKYLLATKLMKWEVGVQVRSQSSFMIDDGSGKAFSSEEWDPMKDEDVMNDLMTEFLEQLRSKK